MRSRRTFQWRQKSVQRLTELVECAVLLAISELNVLGLVSVVVVAPDPVAINKRGTGADGGRRNTGSRRGDGRGRRGRGLGGSQETNLVADGSHSEEPIRPVQHSPEFAFTVVQLAGHERKSSDFITWIVGGVVVSDVLIDSGATCNVVGQQTWEMLKLKGINCESPKHGAWRAVSCASRCLTDVERRLRSDGERGIGIGLGL